MSTKRKIRNSFGRDKSEELLASIGGTHLINPSGDVSKKSLDASLKGTKGSRTITTHSRWPAFQMNYRKVAAFSLVLEFLAYVVLFGYYLYLCMIYVYFLGLLYTV